MESGPAPFLPAARDDLGLLLDFSLLKRTVDELRYELAHQSPRVRVPLLALRQILATPTTSAPR